MHLISPIPNINGSRASDLVAQIMSVSTALEDALVLMRQWQPHGRDYQIGDGDYTADRREFERRHKLVEELAQQYEREAMVVDARSHYKGLRYESKDGPELRRVSNETSV